MSFSPTERRGFLAYAGVWGDDVDEGVQLLGLGTQPDAEIDAPSHNFGEALIGEPGNRPSHTFTITSTGLDLVKVSSFDISGPDASSFVLSKAQDCLTVFPGETCPVTVTFDPKSGPAGPRLATLTADASGKTIEAQLLGEAVTAVPVPGAQLSVKAPKKVKVKKKTRVKVQVKVTNTGTTPLTGARLTLKASQGKSGKSLVSRRISLKAVAPGKSIRKTITINLRKKKLKRNKKALKLTFNLTQNGKKLAARTATTRLDFGQPKGNRR